MEKPFVRVSRIVFCAELLLGGAFGCSGPAQAPAQSAQAAGATGESGAAGSSFAKSESSVPPNGLVGSGPDAPIIAMSMPVQTEDNCNKVAIDFAPKVPAVFILVDRSSSMFEHALWEPLKAGVLAVIEQLDAEVRFGFSSYTGERDKLCPDLSMLVPVADHNYAAIERAYDAIERPQYKAETPTSLAISEVTKLLSREPADDPKYIVLVTDGEPDFCDDPNVTCSRDAVVAAVQTAYSQGIGTFVFSIGGEVDRSHLADVANAGTGAPVEDHQMAVQYQCPQKLGTYSATSGSAPYFEPDVSDQMALVAALTSAISGARSCIFDLQGKVQIDLAMADQGLVTIDGTPVAYGTADGFRMNSPTQLELLGAACMRLKQRQTLRVSIDFPCRAIELL